MIARISKEFTFDAALYFENRFMINSFDFECHMDVITEDAREQNIAVERINYYTNFFLQDSIFVNEKHEDMINLYEQAGLKVLTIPEEPYDQIISVVLLTKFNAVMEGRVNVTDIVFGSRLTDGIKFYTMIEDTENFMGNFWWNDPNPSIKSNKTKGKKDKIVNLSDKKEWTKVNLDWKDKSS